MIKIYPNLSFENAVVKMNSLNLTNLWLNSTIFSYIEFFFDKPQNPGLLFPAIHGEYISLFQRAILNSSSKDYKDRYLTSGYYPQIHDNLVNAAYRPYSKNKTNKIENLLDLFSKIGNSQFRYQQNQLSVRLGRIYAMYYLYPNKYSEWLKEKQTTNYFDQSIMAPKILNGLTQEEFLGILFCVFSLIQARYNETYKVIEDLYSYIFQEKGQELIKRQFFVIGKIVDSQISTNINPIIFSPEQASIENSKKYTPTKVFRFLELLSKTTRELQTLAKQYPEYNIGDLPDQLNPLERYPIVKISRDKYFVPNARFLYDGISNLLHFVFQDFLLRDNLDNRFHQQMGYIQEIFLFNLITEKLKDSTVIQEKSYIKGKNRVDGPDLTIIEAKTNRLITIESKFKHLRNLTRVSPLPEILHNDLYYLGDLIKKLEIKTNDLFLGFEEYEQYQREISQTKENLPIFVVIIGEGIEFMSEIFFRGEGYPSIINLKNSICLMDVENFEELVDYSAQENIALSDLLDEYSRTSRTFDFQKTAAEYLFRDKIDYDQRFSKQYTEQFFKKIGSEFSS